MNLSAELLHLLDNYQAARLGLSPETIAQFRQLADSFGSSVNTCECVLYHKIDLPASGERNVHGRGIEDIFAPGGMTISAASCTLSSDTAMKHKLSMAAEIEDTFGIVFEIPPDRIGSAVIINLDALYRSGAIDLALADHPESEFKMGIRDMGNREQEVIIGPITVTVNDIWAIRPPTQPIASYSAALEQVSPDPKAYEEMSIELYDKLDSTNLIGEHAAWLYGSHARKVLKTALENAASKGESTGYLVPPEEIDAGDEGGFEGIPLA